MKSPLVLISGLLSNERVWQHQMSSLARFASIQVYSPSQETSEKMVEAILDKAPKTFALAGHSMGGFLCLEIMRAAPLRVTRLCLLNTSARPDSEGKKEKRKKMILDAQQGHFKEIALGIAKHFVFNQLVRGDVEQMFLEVGENAFINQEKAMLRRRESESILSCITCPTKIIHAAHDANFSLEEHQELARQIKHSELSVIEDSGHMSPMEAPQAVTDLMKDWLQKA